MAETTYYVDADVVGGLGDGSSWANAYAHLNDAENARDADITGGNAVRFQCRGSTNPDNEAVNVLGWTTDSDSYVLVYGDSEDRHAGVWSNSKYRVYTTDALAFTVTEDYVRIEGIQIGVTSPSTTGRHCFTIPNGLTADANDVRVIDCILKGHNHATYSHIGMNIAEADVLLTIRNCIVFDINTVSSSYGLNFSVDTADVYNCTVIGGQYAIRVGGGVCNVKNCYGGGSGTEDFYRGGGYLYKTNCASEDNSADDINGVVETQSNCLVSKALDNTNFTDVASDNYSLCAGSDLIDEGVDLSGTGFSTDIVGNDRGDEWDIGAWEYVAPPTTIITTAAPTTTAPTTLPPTTLAPTTLPTTPPPTTEAPTTTAPTTLPPTTLAPTTLPPTTLAPTTLPTTPPPTTLAPTTLPPTTLAPTTLPPTTPAPTTVAPTTIVTTAAPTTPAPTTLPPTTLAPTTLAPTTQEPTTPAPTTLAPTTPAPTTVAPTTIAPTTPAPTTPSPTTLATTPAPTTAPPNDIAVSKLVVYSAVAPPIGLSVTKIVVYAVVEEIPPTTAAPTTTPPTLPPTTTPPTTPAPTTLAPTTLEPTTLAPTTLLPSTPAPTTLAPTTPAPTTLLPTTLPSTTLAPTTLFTSAVPTTYVSTVTPTTSIPVFICSKPLISDITLLLLLDSPIAPVLLLNSPITKELEIDGNLCW